MKSTYRPVDVLKRDGSKRSVMEPCQELKREQRWILDNVLSQSVFHPSCHGFITGRSIVTNASQHCGRELVVNVDLTGFFHAVTFRRTRGIFASLGIPTARTNQYAAICTIQTPQGRYLPQGACTSPALANLAASNLDSRLNGIAISLGMVYTRYADDMTLSGGNSDCIHGMVREGSGIHSSRSLQTDSKQVREVWTDERHKRTVGKLLSQLRSIVISEGFKVNEKKTRIMIAPDTRLVTGLDVSGAIPAIPLRTLERYVRILGKPHSQETEAGIKGHMLMVNR